MNRNGSDVVERPAEASARMQYCLFDTPIGRCGLAWSARGVRKLQLPERDAATTEKRLRVRGVEARKAPTQIEQVIADIQSYTSGRRIDFSGVALDLAGTDAFEQSVYAAARRIPWGGTITYGELALQIGAPQAARAVGRALARNPVPIIVPCHRILAKGQRVGGFSAYGGVFTKQHLLALEGVRVEAPTPFFPGFR